MNRRTGWGHKKNPQKNDENGVGEKTMGVGQNIFMKNLSKKLKKRKKIFENETYEKKKKIHKTF